MRRCWWTVWIWVAVMAVLLFSGYKFAMGMVRDLVSPYIIEEDQIGERSDNKIKEIVEKVEAKLNVRFNYEDLIFDYANDYAGKMMAESREERQFEAETYSIVEEYEDSDTETRDDTE